MAALSALSPLRTHTARCSRVMPICTTFRRGLSLTYHAVTGASFMKTSHPTGRQIRKRHFDLVVGISPHACCTVFSNQSVSHRLARVPSLHPDRQAVEIADPVHVGQPSRVDDQRLT